MRSAMDIFSFLGGYLALLFCSLGGQVHAQTNVYAPFSGAIYVVGPNGQWTNQVPAGYSYCSNVGQSGWCCASSYVCGLGSNSYVGCCPQGSYCSGAVNVQEIRTVTVTQVQYVPTTVVQTQTQAYCAQCNAITTTYYQPATVVPAAATSKVVYNGYCSTLTANGPNLPTTAQGGCGTILVVNEGARRDGGFILFKAFAGAICTLIAGRLALRRWI